MSRKDLASFCIAIFLIPIISSAQSGERTRPPDNPPTGTATPRESPPPSQPPNPAPPVYVPYNSPYPYPYGSWYTPGNCGFPLSLEGSIKLKIVPKNAQVFVDGGFVGYVDNYDGKLEGLKIREGLYKIELRADDYETLRVDVRVLPGKTVTFSGELKKR